MYSVSTRSGVEVQLGRQNGGLTILRKRVASRMLDGLIADASTNGQSSSPTEKDKHRGQNVQNEADNAQDSAFGW